MFEMYQCGWHMYFHALLWYWMNRIQKISSEIPPCVVTHYSLTTKNLICFFFLNFFAGERWFSGRACIWWYQKFNESKCFTFIQIICCSFVNRNWKIIELVFERNNGCAIVHDDDDAHLLTNVSCIRCI